MMSTNKTQTHLSEDIEKLNEENQSFTSCKVICNFLINYVVTIKESYSNLEAAKALIADKKSKSYEKIYHPIFLKLILRKQNDFAEILLRRNNSNIDRLIHATNVKEDHKNPNYFYLETSDKVDPKRRRTHIFNSMNAFNMQQVRTENPMIGSPGDLINNQYSIPENMLDVVCCIQTYCLPTMGQHVKSLKEKMNQPLKRVFSKKPRPGNEPTKTIPRFQFHFSEPHHNITNHELIAKMSHKPSAGLSDFKSKSIENLLLANNDFEDLINFSNYNSRYSNNKDIKKTLSTQSSLSEDDNIKNFKSEEDLYFYKFENVLTDDIGLKHFKNFLTDEVSSENINFWQAVDNFSKIMEEKLLKCEAQKIFFTYMDEQAITPVNLECEVVEKVRRKLKEPSIDMFNVAKNHIYHLMKNDSYSRFIISPHFNLWLKHGRNDTIMKSTASTSSLPHNKKRKSLFPPFKINRTSKEESRKSSIQTIDSDSSSCGLLSNNCKITLAYDVISVHYVNISQNKKISIVLKKLDKKFNENDFVAFDEHDHKNVNFNDNMSNILARKIVVERAALVRIGFVQNNLDTGLFEDIWFVLRSRRSLILASAIDPVLKRLQLQIENCCFIQDDNLKAKLEWNCPMDKLNQTGILLLDQKIYFQAKIFGKGLPENLDSLWKRIMRDQSFQSTLPFDNDNLLDSRSDFFQKFKHEPRRIGYLISNLRESNQTSRINRDTSSSFDDQRGIFTEQQLQMPDFLKIDETDRSSDVSNCNNTRSLSALTLGDSDFSFSEFDESSDPSPENMELMSDLE